MVEGGSRGGEDGTQGHGKGLKKKADALDVLRQIGQSAGRGAQDLANSAATAGTSAAGSSADYLKTHPHAALAATAGAGYLGYRGLKRGVKGAVGGVARALRGAPKPPPSFVERLGRAAKVLRGVE
jgi:hypothetical protein